MRMNGLPLQHWNVWDEFRLMKVNTFNIVDFWCLVCIASHVHRIQPKSNRYVRFNHIVRTAAGWDLTFAKHKHQHEDVEQVERKLKWVLQVASDKSRWDTHTTTTRRHKSDDTVHKLLTFDLWHADKTDKSLLMGYDVRARRDNW